MPEKGPNPEDYPALFAAVTTLIIGPVLFLLAADIATGESILLGDKEGNPVDFTDEGRLSMSEVKLSAYVIAVVSALLTFSAAAFLYSKAKK